MSKFNILVVEDEEAIRDMLVMVLEQAGFATVAAESAVEAQSALDQAFPDLILLDWMLPVTSGVEWVRRLKKEVIYQDIPVILLTARGEEEDKVKGLEVGADDYVTKPFSPKELVARIRAVLRRAGKISATDTISVGDLQLDMGQHRFSIGNRQVEISPTEFRMVQFFMTHPDKVFSRSQLLDQIWGRSVFIEERTIDVHIRRLRKILDEYERGDLLQTVRGFGYKFSLTDSTVSAVVVNTAVSH
ncbi:DNA-binding response regulator in two-component regulatory system with PhoR (or CreC) [Crenothrix polyspora]|uniref:Phosphate regulon transcriptional regulatory protein PhoB n=1 Tax=Crenothrix polyspora TaxID=360316 RepID=A0A1R4H1C4_9GAMM|nr:phosphate regulon transcriptional regulator PhoB [Crenothrix polyspora]SJM90006.1 DNA-binding response regulator in two-component regulatory system with PhoR (or CreC) [Crenothrix polyspora]